MTTQTHTQHTDLAPYLSQLDVRKTDMIEYIREKYKVPDSQGIVIKQGYITKDISLDLMPQLTDYCDSHFKKCDECGKKCTHPSGKCSGSCTECLKEIQYHRSEGRNMLRYYTCHTVWKRCSEMMYALETVGLEKDNELLSLINTRENSNCYYGPSNRENQESATVCLIQHPVPGCGLFDFCGNVFEMQDTEYVPIGKKSIVHQPSDIPAWHKVYNCSGGGWQHTNMRLPTQYMGQFTAFTRNHDIGFRVVSGTHKKMLTGEEITESPKDKTIGELTYGESFAESFLEGKSAFIDMSKINLQPTKPNSEVVFSHQTMNSAEDKSNRSIRFFSNSREMSVCTEKVMLLAVGYDIYAYHLLPLATVKDNDGGFIGAKLMMREPQLEANSRTRKTYSNKKSDYLFSARSSIFGADVTETNKRSKRFCPRRLKRQAYSAK